MENNESESIKIEPVVEPNNEIEEKSVANEEKRNSKDEKSKKKHDKIIQQVFKCLNSLDTPEARLSAICKRHSEVLEENRKLQMMLKQSDKKILMIQREKEQFQSEKSKAVLARSRLESLCRELQRQNKAVKEESLLKIREEEEKRKEVSAKFQSTLAEFTALMAETNEKNVKLHEDNIEMHKKFKSVFDEMDIREQHFEGMHEMMKRELQVTEAKLAKVTVEMTEEKEAMLKEKNALLLKLTEYQTRIRELQQIETNLRSQLNVYTDKYDEFQSALTKSNEVFGGFNEEMEKMLKKILKLEKEKNLWKSRCEKSHAALLEMAADKQTRDASIATLNRKCSLLQELCKTLQQERASLLAQLREKTAKSETNAETKTEDNQKVESVENFSEDSKVNGSSNINGVNAKIEEQTKDLKTDATCPLTDTVKLNDNESIKENKNSNAELETEINVNKTDIEDITKTVNSEDEKSLIENVPVKKPEETPSTITEKIVQAESSTCNKEENNLQVPVELKDSIPSETATQNSEQSIKVLEVETKNESDHVVSNTLDVMENINESEVSNKLENHLQELVISEIKDVPKVEDNTQNTNKVPNGEVHSKQVTNKKHKEGKKKRK